MFSQENNEIIHPEIRELDLISPLKDSLFNDTALSWQYHTAVFHVGLRPEPPDSAVWLVLAAFHYESRAGGCIITSKDSAGWSPGLFKNKFNGLL